MTTTVVCSRIRPEPQGQWIGRRTKYHGDLFQNPHTWGLSDCEGCSKRFRIKTRHKLVEVQVLFGSYFFDRVARDSDFRACVLKLRGQVLLGTCQSLKKDGSGWCHGKTIAEFLDSLPLPATEEEVIEAARGELLKLVSKEAEVADV